MHFKVDEDLPPAIAALLQEHGYVSSTVVEQGMGGWKDPQLWQAAQNHQQFLVTADKGFSDIRTYPPGSHFGILLLRPNEDGIRPMLELMEQVLASVARRTPRTPKFTGPKAAQKGENHAEYNGSPFRAGWRHRFLWLETGFPGH